MRLMLVDVGNTNIKRCVAEDGIFGPVDTAPTSGIEPVAAEIAAVGLPVALSCVRIDAAAKIRNALQDSNIPLLCDISPNDSGPLSGFYEGMGADRIAAAVGAWSQRLIPGPIAVIGLGTGTSITVIDDQGVFAGGYTTLGLGPISAHLAAALPALPKINPAATETLEPGFNVYNALCRGTLLAHIGLVEKWVQVSSENLQEKTAGAKLAVYATGGWSRTVSQFTDCIDCVDPLLTLRGIWIIAQSMSNS